MIRVHRDGPPADPKDRFLDAFEAETTYLSIIASCEAASVDVATFREWMKSDPDFADLVKAIKRRAGEKLQTQAFRQAMAGNETLLRALLKALLPDVYGDRQTIDINITREDINSTSDVARLKEIEATCLKLAKDA